VAFRRVAAALGETVQALRKKQHWTVEHAAEEFGIEPAHVRRIEAGRTNPSLAVLVSIARALRVPLATLVGGTRRTATPHD
jgi:transcriptional regulator with XRE-family HTH domain